MARFIPPHLRIRQPYSIDLRERIIYLRHVLKCKVHQIAHVLNMTQRSVERVLQRWRNTGEVVPLGMGKKGKRMRVMDYEEIGVSKIYILQEPSPIAITQFLLALLERKPDLYLDELQGQLAQEHGVIVGVSTIWDTLGELGLTRKKLSKAAAERNHEQRSRYKFLIGSEKPERLVFIGRGRIDIPTSYRLNGWAKEGYRARVKAKFLRGYSLLPALSTDGIIYSQIKEGAYDGPGFVEYIESLLPHMSPWPGPHSVLVMDDRAIHHADDILSLCETRGIRVYYLPPYSPDLNPIEEAFSFVKSDIRHNGVLFRNAVESQNQNAVFFELHCALAMITSEKAKAWMGNSGYLCIEA